MGHVKGVADQVSDRTSHTTMNRGYRHWPIGTVAEPRGGKGASDRGATSSFLSLDSDFTGTNYIYAA